jgi:hypothetical protein
MEKDLPNSTSPYAAEGTAAHDLAERCLLNDTNPQDYAGEKIKVDKDGGNYEFEVTADMIDAVKTYVDYCRSLEATHSLVEEKFDLPFLGPEEKGTSDYTGLAGPILHVVDYKHGKGVPVEVEENVQGLCYGLGAAERFKSHNWHTLRITIVQPRAFHDDGPIRTWDLDRDEIYDYLMNFAVSAKETENPEAELNVGDWCRFCKAKALCPEQLAHAERVMEMDFTEPTSKPVPIDFLSREQITDLVLNRVKQIEQWCQSVKDFAQSEAEAGNPLPGTKLVATRAVRKWVDKNEAENLLSARYGEKVYNKSFMSAPQVEKAIGKKEFDDFSKLVDKISTGVTLVPESDKRPSVRPSVEDEFAT